jgi:uroporphyrinogen-III decarboxylase
MCQLSIGHQLLVTGVDPVDYFLDSSVYADTLLTMREGYRFSGILLHKPGRDPKLPGLLARSKDSEGVPCLTFPDGARIRCRHDDDPMFLGGDGFQQPEEVEDLDPDQPLAWAPESYRHWCSHKGTAPYETPEAIPDYWFDAVRKVRARVGDEFAVHGEVRSPLDHLFAVLGMQNGLMGLLTAPGHSRAVLNTVTRWSIAFAVAQVRAGCDAIKLSSPYAGAGFISRDQYREWVVPCERGIAEAVRAEGAAIYTHTCGAIGDRLDLMAETGVNGIEALDPPPLGTTDLAEAKQHLRDRLFVKGNVNAVALRTCSVEEARTQIRQTLEIGRQGGQYILSSACSIAPTTPPENVEQFAAVAEAEG